MASGSFEYPPLDKTKSQIRLLEILPQPDSSLQYNLTTFDVSTCPPYIALSYVWGNDEPTNTIVINGQNFFIRDNLSCALPRLANLRSSGDNFEFKRPESHFWIDAICINQNDTKERNHQVELMKDIFTRASLTAAWLGQGYEKRLRPRKVTRFEYEPEDEHLPFYENMDIMACNPYFKRMWIVQEVILSRDIWVMCDDEICTWGVLKVSCRLDRDIDLIEHRLETDAAAYPWTGYDKLQFRRLDGSALDPLVNLHSLVWSRAEYKLRKPKLADLLYLYLDRECRDTRDRIYALLGLLSSETLELSPLPVDYDLRPEDLFEVAYKYLRENSNGADGSHGRDWVWNLRIALNLPAERFEFPHLHKSHLG